MNKQEILDEINKTKEHLAEGWRPKKGDEYWYVDTSYRVHSFIFTNDKFDNFNINTYNCFRTKEQAKAEAEKILVRRMLEDIARRLNKGEKIDWKDKNQKKYFFAFDNKNEIFITDYCYCYIKPAIYCLHSNFTDVAIKEIGEERLKKYLRGE